MTAHEKLELFEECLHAWAHKEEDTETTEETETEYKHISCGWELYEYD